MAKKLSRAEITALSVAAGRAYSISPALLRALWWVESSWQPDAVSSAGAVGLGQLMPATARELGINGPGRLDPLVNAYGSAAYLGRMFAKFGTAELALAAYNCGPGNVRRNRIPTSTHLYVNRIVTRLRQEQQESTT